MPIDLSNSFLARESRAEGALAARRDDVRRVIIRRFGDETLAERVVASVPEDLLENAIDVAVTAVDADELTAWLRARKT